MVKVSAVVGPTCSGKTSLSIEIAKRYNGEIISCDSMQIYKYLNIGTAKPSEYETSVIPHHLIDFVDPREDFSCAEYSKLAKECISELVIKNKFPIFCGGTGLYIDHVLNNTRFTDVGCDVEYREYLKKIAFEKGNEFLHSKLKEIDIKSAENIHLNNVQRVIRALEIYHLTGKTKSYWDNQSMLNKCDYDSVIFFLDFRNREELYKRIDKRVDLMVEQGLVDEVNNLLKNKILIPGTTAYQAIGYKEIAAYLENQLTLAEAVENVKKSTRNYAKRQLTWFRRNKNSHVVYVDEFPSVSSMANYCGSFL